MAFLDNSGDIILDAVLTDTGRYRLAKGDGSFKIVKFALGDDEINYGLYNKMDPSGSAYYDLEILQTPVLEAFTNNASSMKSKLISIPRTNLLYLPVLMLADGVDGSKRMFSPATSGSYVVASDTDSVKSQANGGLFSDNNAGLLNGASPGNEPGSIRVDQGLNTTEISPQFNLDSDLVETGYIVQIDNRLGSIVAPDSTASPAAVSFIDDDNIASYYFSLGTDAAYVSGIEVTGDQQQQASIPSVTPIRGPRGTRLQFKVQASIELQTSTFLFTQLGSTIPADIVNGAACPLDVRYIDSIVKVTGQTTGYRVDIPVRFAKV